MVWYTYQSVRNIRCHLQFFHLILMRTFDKATTQVNEQQITVVNVECFTNKTTLQLYECECL